MIPQCVACRMQVESEIDIVGVFATRFYCQLPARFALPDFYRVHAVT